MAPPKLTASDRYIHPEVAKIYVVDTIANVNSPTRLELDAGTDITDEVAAATGFDVSADRVATPDLGFKFVSRISGRINPGDSQLVCYASRNTVDIRDRLQRGDQTHVCILLGGDVAGRKMDVYPVEVSAISKPVDVAGSEGARIMVDVAITGTPGEDVAVPA